MFEAFGFTWHPPQCRNLSQLPSRLTALVVSLALSDSPSLMQLNVSSFLTSISQPCSSLEVFSNARRRAIMTLFLGERSADLVLVLLRGSRMSFCSFQDPLVCISLSSVLSPLYLAEISPPEVRGSLMALEQFAIVLGVVLGFWTGFFTRGCMYSSLYQACRLFSVIMTMPFTLFSNQ